MVEAGSAVIIEGPEIDVYRLISLKYALKLEMKGLKRSRSPSAYVILKRDLGIKGSRTKVLAHVDALITSLRGSIWSSHGS